MLMEDAFGDFSDSDIDSEDWDDRRIDDTSSASRAQRLKDKIFTRNADKYVALGNQAASSSSSSSANGLVAGSSAPNVFTFSSSQEPIPLQDLNSDSTAAPSSSMSDASASSSHLLPTNPTPEISHSDSTTQGRREGFFNRGLFAWRGNSNANGARPRNLSFNNQNDGVFNNITAKPETEKPEDSDVPPSYEEAAADAAPLYWETTIMAPGYSDEIFIDGLPVGSPINFIWNLMVSAAFQFVGFLLTYLLHTSHAAKHGARAGLGVTLFQYGFYLQPSFGGGSSGSSNTGPSREFEPNNPNNYDVSSDRDSLSGSYNQATPTASADTGDTNNASGWIAIVLMVLGFCIITKSVFDYIRVRKMEMMIVQSPSSVVVDREDADNMV